MNKINSFFNRRPVLLIGMILNLFAVCLLLSIACRELHGVWPPESLVPGPRPLIGLHFGHSIDICVVAFCSALLCVGAFLTLLGAFFRRP